MRMFLNTLLCIPTLNPGESAKALIDAINMQSMRPSKLLVIDSSSTDESIEYFKSNNFDVHVIKRAEFNHGGTRQLAVKMFPEMDIIIYLTQDAVLANEDAFEKIISCFNDPKVAAAYGRQLPRPGATLIESHARLFNYAPKSQIKSLKNMPDLGIKTIFISNSFAAYRRSALEKVGGFPTSTIFGEDTCVAGKMVLSGLGIAYCAEAMVYHSHDYHYIEEFKRYFDIGVLHSKEPWIKEQFGVAASEGKRFVVSELKYLMRNNPLLVFSALIRTILKAFGYRLGLRASHMSVGLKRKLSMHRNYWDEV